MCIIAGCDSTVVLMVRTLEFLEPPRDLRREPKCTGEADALDNFPAHPSLAERAFSKMHGISLGTGMLQAADVKCFTSAWSSRRAPQA